MSASEISVWPDGLRTGSPPFPPPRSIRPHRAASPTVPALHGSGSPAEIITTTVRKVVSGIGQVASAENCPQRPVIRQPPVGAADWPLSLWPPPFSTGQVVDFCAAQWPDFTPALTHCPDIPARPNRLAAPRSPPAPSTVTGAKISPETLRTPRRSATPS
jgi:hypothetical protein